MLTWWRRYLPALAMCLVLFAAACGGADDDTTTGVDSGGDLEQPAAGGDTTGDGTPIPVEPDGGIGDGAGPPAEAPDGDDAPIPVEPDGGIGDGAGPPPGVEDEQSGSAGDWHGAQVAETNCPGIDFVRIEASAFSFSVPSDVVDRQAQGIDSEVGILSSDSIEVSYDYGWYSGSFDGLVGDITDIEYSGISGQLAVVGDRGGWNGRNLVGVFFPEVDVEFDQPNRLNLVVLHDDAADEIIGRCIVGSIEWNLSDG